MEMQIHGRNIDVTPAIKTYVNRKFDRLTRHMPQMMDATMEFGTNASRTGEDRFVVQMTVTVKGQTLRAQRRAPTLYEAVDAATDVMDRQIRRYKGRRYRSNQERKALRNLPAGLAPELDEEIPAPDEMEDITTKVVRRKHFPMIAMTVDDAIAEMEMLNHSFYLFRNVEIGTYSVVYRREDGDYGLIEPIEV